MLRSTSCIHAVVYISLKDAFPPQISGNPVDAPVLLISADGVPKCDEHLD
jgi:hypothetical protein